jgi:signal transduction histidine kinase
MFSNWKSIIAALIVCAVPLAVATAGSPSKDEVTARVKSAIVFYKANGRDKALAELNNKEGQFASGEDYVDVHDLNGVCVAHPVTPALVGVNRLEQADPSGKLVYKDMITASKAKPSGWIEYMRKNPIDGKIEKKIAYWELYDGLIFKAGTYEAAK